MAFDPERREIFILVARAKNNGSLTPDEAARLRRLMSSRNPSAPRLSVDELLSASRFATGVWLAFEPDTIGLDSIDPASVT